MNCSTRPIIGKDDKKIAMQIILPPTLRTTVSLPASKSISARALILRALSTNDGTIDHLSDCDDTRAVIAALRDKPDHIDIGAAGTAMRFLTAFFATREGETHTLTGTTRMQQRPIAPLVDALRALGADIRYERAEGFPPITVYGRELTGGTLSLPADVSSQYVSALLMIAPTLHEGLDLHLVGKIASAPYIRMTLELMRVFGVQTAWDGGAHIRVPHAQYRCPETFAVEPDWSAASYWYECVALSPDAKACVRLPGLRRESVQGDAACAQIFAKSGVRTHFETEGVVLTKHTDFEASDAFHYDFSDTPDLAQAAVVTCCMQGKSFRFSGLESLRIKETDRIAALMKELHRYGIALVHPEDGVLTFAGGKNANEKTPIVPTDDTDEVSCDGDDTLTLRFEDAECHVVREMPPTVRTYEDHRMAMAFAPTVLRRGCVKICVPDVVSKSYPRFWDDLQSIGTQHRDH